MINKCFVGFLLACVLGAKAETNVTVRAFGAVGDGKTKDTAAFQKAFDACAAAGGGTVSVSNGIFLIGSVTLGPNTTLQIEGKSRIVGSPDIEDYPLVKVRWEGEFAQGHRALISAEKAWNITIKGRGFFFGPPYQISALRNPRGPVLMEFTECENVTLDGFTTQYQQLWSIHPLFCKGFTARNLTIRSASANGDGIDVDSCTDVLIDRCDINTGDDAVALKSGRGMAAFRLARPTANVTIRDSTLISSIYAGVAFGTELSGGLQNIRIMNCIIGGRQNAIFMKSRDGRGAYIENVTGENLMIQNSGTFIGINLRNKGIQASDPVSGDVEKWTVIRKVTFSDVTLHKVGNLLDGENVLAKRPVENLTLTNIRGDCAKGIKLANMTNVVLAGIEVAGYEGPLLNATNVTGSGLGLTK